MRQHLFEHSTGVFLHVLYEPAPPGGSMSFQDIRIADTNYEPVGPNLIPFLHNTHMLDSTGPVTMATPVLELIAGDIIGHH
jgi:hypothetical protein